MKTKVFLTSFFLLILLFSCNKRVDYSEEFISQTSGRYLYNQEEIIEIFYDDNELFLKWKGAERIKPVILDEETFFIPDMYNKLHFVQHPETKKRYLSIVNKDDESKVTYDYLKVDAGYKTPRMFLKDNEFDKALEGYLAIQEQDSTSVLIDESDFNSLGYEYLRKKNYEKAINVLKINVALYPKSENVYDSLADAYLFSGDSLNALNCYKKSF